MPIEVTIVDDHFLVREGLKKVINNDTEIQIIGTFSSGETFLEQLKACCPDVVLLDLQMPGIQGVELVVRVLKTQPGISIIILTGHESLEYARKFFDLGCRGYLMKGSADNTAVITAIKQVYSGEIYLSNSIKDDLLYDLMNVRKGKNKGIPKITKREHEVLHLLEQGLSSQQMADKICLSIRTIESHRSSLLRKLNAINSAQLLKKGKEYNFL